VYEALKAQAEPFVDTPNSVIRRLLLMRPLDQAGKPDDKPPSRSRDTEPSAEEMLPQRAYYRPILKALVSRGGQARVRNVVDDVGRQMAHLLTPADRDELKTGGVRWRNRAQWARLDMVGKGYLKSSSPKGTWEITDKGRAFLESADG
jgi:hypothetical protein